GRLRGRGGGAGAALGPPLEGGLVVQEGGQLAGQVGVAGQEGGPVRRPSLLDGLVVGGDRLVQPRVAVGLFSHGTQTSGVVRAGGGPPRTPLPSQATSHTRLGAP